MMTPEQHKNLLAMYRAHNAEAALAIGLVLGFYAILLVIYICRYAFCVSPSSERGATPPIPRSREESFVCCCCECKIKFMPESAVAFYKRVCCGQIEGDEESAHQVIDIPMVSIPPRD